MAPNTSCCYFIHFIQCSSQFQIHVESIYWSMLRTPPVHDCPHQIWELYLFSGYPMCPRRCVVLCDTDRWNLLGVWHSVNICVHVSDSVSHTHSHALIMPGDDAVDVRRWPYNRNLDTTWTPQPGRRHHLSKPAAKNKPGGLLGRL